MSPRWLAIVAAIAGLAAACSSSSSTRPSSTTADLGSVVATTEGSAVPLAPPSSVPEEHGGVVRVAMWVEPDVEAAHMGGQIVRSLVYPQLFTARPDGGWAPRLVEPGSVLESGDLTSVSFALREEAVWSDGVPITAEDLAFSADERFVSKVDVVRGRVEVTFTQPLPGWRRLWSGQDSVVPPTEGVFGGPFRISSHTPGLEIVLEPNDAWWGVRADEGPFLDELRILVVPDQVTLLQLFESGALDVVAPWAYPGREAELAALEAAQGGEVVHESASGEGWLVAALANPDELGDGDRRSLLSGFDPSEFVGSLLKGEASPVLSPDLVARDVADLGIVPTITMAEDVPMLGLAGRAVQIQADDAGGRVPELRQAPTRLVDQWQAEGDYDLLVAALYLGPSPCFVCVYGLQAPGEAELADAGDRSALDTTLVENALARSLWIPERTVAWRDDVRGVEANGYALFVTWNAWRWWVS